MLCKLVTLAHTMFLNIHACLIWLYMNYHHISIFLVALTSFLILWHIYLDCLHHFLHSLSLKGWMSLHSLVMSSILQNFDHPITLQLVQPLHLCQVCHWWSLLWIAMVGLVLILLVSPLLSQIYHHIGNGIVVIPILSASWESMINSVHVLMSIFSWCLFWFYLTTS